MTREEFATSLREAPGTMILDRGGQVERYSMGQIPEDGSTLVRAATGRVLDDRDLSSVVPNLRRASDLLFVAHACTAGTPAVQADLAECQTRLPENCGDYSIIMTELQRGCGSALQSLTRCFQRLLAADEDTALYHLSGCSAAAYRMARVAGSYTSPFLRLQGRMEADFAEIFYRAAIPRSEIDEFERMRYDLRKSLRAQTQLRIELNDGVEALRALGDELRTAEDARNQQQAVAPVVGAVRGVAGHGPGGYAAMVTATGPATADRRRAVLQKELELEKERRSAAALVTRFVEKIGAGDRRFVVAVSASAALAAAVWVFHELSNALGLAAGPWRDLESACNAVDGRKLRDNVEQVVRDVAPAARIAVYDSAPFKEDAIRSLASWRATQMFSESHRTMATDVRAAVEERLKGAEPKVRLLDVKDGILRSLQKEEGDRVAREAALGELLTATGATIPG